MISTALWALIISVVCGLIGVFPPGRPGRWWRLNRMACFGMRPVASEADPSAAQSAVAALRKSKLGRKLTATIIRVGTEHSANDLWVCVTDTKGAESAAANLARSAGCELTERCDPPRLEGGFWFTGKPVPYPENSAPEGVRLNALEQTDFHLEFPEHAGNLMTQGDAFVVSLRPARDGVRCWALVATTCEPLATSWLQHGPTESRRMLPGPSSILAGVAGVLGLLIAAFADRSAGIPLEMVFGGGAAAAGIGLGGWGAWTPKRARRVSIWGSLPLTALSLRGAETVPAKLLAGWGCGGERTAIQTPQKEAPREVTVESGARVGVDARQRPAYIPDDDRQWGVFVCGDRGFGKTTLLLNLLKWDSQFRASGGARTIVWIETKGEGARRAAEVIASGGIEPLVLRCAVSEGPRLELVDWADPERSGFLIEEAMSYAFDTGAIMAKSGEILRACIEAAVALPPDACRVLGFDRRPHVLRVAYWLLGGDSAEGMPQRTRDIVRQSCGEHGKLYLSYLDRSDRDLRQDFDSSRNKVSNLMVLSPLFDDLTSRPVITLERIISEHHAVVIDLSQSSRGGTWTDQTATRAAAMVFYRLWDAVLREGKEWQKLGRSIAVYSDELKDLAVLGDSKKELVQVMADQGRSFGILPVFAAQRADQLPPGTRTAIESFGSRAYFRLDHRVSAENASKDLDDIYSPTEIRKLHVGECVARLVHTRESHAPFTLYPENL